MNEKYIKIIAAIMLGIAVVMIGYKVYTNYQSAKYLAGLSFAEFEEKTNTKDSFPLLITAEGCHYCELFLTTIKEVTKEYKVTVYYIDLAKLSDEEKIKLKTYFTANSTPTLIFIKDGEEKSTLNRLVGNQSKEDLVEKLILNEYIKE